MPPVLGDDRLDLGQFDVALPRTGLHPRWSLGGRSLLGGAERVGIGLVQPPAAAAARLGLERDRFIDRFGATRARANFSCPGRPPRLLCDLGLGGRADLACRCWLEGGTEKFLDVMLDRRFNSSTRRCRCWVVWAISRKMAWASGGTRCQSSGDIRVMHIVSPKSPLFWKTSSANHARLGVNVYLIDSAGSGSGTSGADCPDCFRYASFSDCDRCVGIWAGNPGDRYSLSI